MDRWNELLSPQERVVWSRFVARKVLGQRPAVIVVDVTYSFVGSRAAPIGQAVQEFTTSCGDRGWAAVEQIAPLLALARERGTPIFFTTNITQPYAQRQWADRLREPANRALAPTAEIEHRRRGNAIVDELAPRPGETVIEKSGASAFFGTALAADLNALDVDTLIITGGTTSGCVRATAVDAACSSFYVGVVADCVFDRFDISHRVSLLDIEAKYGRVLTRADAEAYLSGAVAESPNARRSDDLPTRETARA
jgi:maleamate amidohydrolase